MTEQSAETSPDVGCDGCCEAAGAESAGLCCGRHQLADVEEATPYVDAVEEYLVAASWLGPADAPLKVHARSIAKSLDKQLAERGEVQSALASSFDKVLYRLDARRPPARPRPPGLDDDDGDGTPSMFGFIDE